MKTNMIITSIVLVTLVIIITSLNIKGITDNSIHKIGLEYGQLKIYSEVTKNQQN